MSLLVIPVFIAHQGCPHRCIFCDQHTISGHSAPEDQLASAATVKETIEQWLDHPRKEKRNEVQVAFYGGSFTGLPIERQKELLGSVKPQPGRYLLEPGSEPDLGLIPVPSRFEYMALSSGQPGTSQSATSICQIDR